MRLLDCTLRDGANVVGLGFNKELTVSMIRGLIDCGITEIEFGNAHGIGCNEPGSPLSDEDYIELAGPYVKKTKLGMFLLGGQYGIDDVYLSVPAVINRNGVEDLLNLHLTDEESCKLKESAAVLRAMNNKL